MKRSTATKRFVSLSLIAVGLGSFGLPASATAEGVQAADSSHEGLTPLDDPPKKKKVLCSWWSYANLRYMCGEPPLAAFKKKCDQQITKEIGQPSECSCTDDQDYIKDTCD